MEAILKEVFDWILKYVVTLPTLVGGVLGYLFGDAVEGLISRIVKYLKG
jgi:membrane protein YqaA with SNARE-associated domain